MARNSTVFPFGQIQKKIDPNHPYIQPISGLVIDTYQNRPSDSEDENIIFEDKKITAQTNFLTTQYYLLRVEIERGLSEQIIDVSLQNTYDPHAVGLTSQYLGKYIIPPKISTKVEWSTLEIIFQPMSNDFKYIIFTLQRTVKDDYSNFDPYSTEGQKIGRTFKIRLKQSENKTSEQEQQGQDVPASDAFGYFTNLVPEGKTLVKIGIQSTPGSLFCINGQAIRVGPSGLYQINNGYKIKFIGAATLQQKSKNSQNNNLYDYDYFTIDYRYE